MVFTLKAHDRDKEKTPATLRKEGLLPAVFYGRKEKSTMIAIPRSEFKKVWEKAGESSIITLETPGGKLPTLIHEVQIDPVKDEPIHADFYVVEENKHIEAVVPLEFVGVSPAVKELGGVLVKVLHELKIKVLPKHLPHSLEIDLSLLAALDSHITVGDIKLPESAAAVAQPNDIVVSVSAAKEEVEEVPQAIDLGSIEVEKKGKKEEEGAAGAEAEAKTKA